MHVSRRVQYGKLIPLQTANLSHRLPLTSWVIRFNLRCIYGPDIGECKSLELWMVFHSQISNHVDPRLNITPTCLRTIPEANVSLNAIPLGHKSN